MTLAAGKAGEFMAGHTALGRSVLVPSIKLYLASEITPLWLATEAYLAAENIAPPFWAFAWPGAEALARYILDNPALVKDKNVLDFAAGCGLAAIAAVQAGAGRVTASEIDPLACAALALNAQVNEVTFEILNHDVVGQPCVWDVILCGDVCYEAPMTQHILPWLRDCARMADVIIADPGRKYAPRDGIAPLATFSVPTSLALEDRAQRDVSLLRLAAG